MFVICVFILVLFLSSEFCHFSPDYSDTYMPCPVTENEVRRYFGSISRRHALANPILPFRLGLHYLTRHVLHEAVMTRSVDTRLACPDHILQQMMNCHGFYFLGVFWNVWIQRNSARQQYGRLVMSVLSFVFEAVINEQRKSSKFCMETTIYIPINHEMGHNVTTTNMATVRSFYVFDRCEAMMSQVMHRLDHLLFFSSC